MTDQRVVIEVGPIRSAKGGVASMAVLSERALVSEGWTVVPVETVGISNGRAGALESARAVSAAIRVIHHNPHAVVHIHSSQGGSLLRKGLIARAASRRGNRVVFHIHGSHFDEWVSRRAISRWWARRVLSDWSDVVIGLSNTWTERVQQLAPRASVVCLPNAVELLDLSHGVLSSEPLIVFAGRVGARKGVDVLLDSLAIVQRSTSRFRVDIAGDGEVLWARGIAENLPRSELVEVSGWLANEDLRRLLREAAIFVLPSRDEGLPVVLLEAMSAGLACVVSRVGAMPEAVDDCVNGLLVQPGNAAELAAALEKLINDVELRNRLGAAASVTARSRYGLELYGRRLSALLSADTGRV